MAAGSDGAWEAVCLSPWPPHPPSHGAAVPRWGSQGPGWEHRAAGWLFLPPPNWAFLINPRPQPSHKSKEAGEESGPARVDGDGYKSLAWLIGGLLSSQLGSALCLSRQDKKEAGVF